MGAVSGLREDTPLVGIDCRGQDGRPYGVGDAGGVYAIGDKTAQAALLHRLEVPLAGTRLRRGPQCVRRPAADRQ
ncbi:DUF4394 domain-containing protein [Streptomyces sp. I6]|uniref:DUF4394 domain-containing protein n=1 Tax=Streptomyces sp. I6 TaxID=2483113 RepID=UPI0037DA00EE